MIVHELSHTEARRIAVRAQLPDRSRPARLLYGDRLVGKVDVTADRKAGVV